MIDGMEVVARKSPREARKAPIRNLVNFDELIERVVNRSDSLPGMACFYGYSGYGKTYSATYGANAHSAFYIEMGESWTKKTLLQQIAREVGIRGQDKASIPDLLMATADRLSDEPYRPLIIDEADYLAKKGMIDIVRELHDKSGAAIILIGEELLPSKLKEFERAHNRILDWVPALPCDLRDAQMIARTRAPGIEVSDDLLEAMITKCDGRARRIAVNLSRVVEQANIRGLQRMTLLEWGDAPFFTGEPPRRRGM